jgi:hypothetical protein
MAFADASSAAQLGAYLSASLYFRNEGRRGQARAFSAAPDRLTAFRAEARSLQGLIEVIGHLHFGFVAFAWKC